MEATASGLIPKASLSSGIITAGAERAEDP